LPYSYVLSAVKQGSELRRQQLHESERSTALISSILANQNRDSKRKKEPYKFTEFCFYADNKSSNLPSGEYGAAALKLVKDGLFPPWALFCFKELASAGESAELPEVLAYIASDAIVLGPKRVGNHVEGLLIALESASNRTRVFLDQDGNKIRLEVPQIHTKIIATEEEVLFVA